jgi:hypothetical protein
MDEYDIVVDKRYPLCGQGEILRVNRDGTVLVYWYNDNYYQTLLRKNLRKV